MKSSKIENDIGILFEDSYKTKLMLRCLIHILVMKKIISQNDLNECIKQARKKIQEENVDL